jgi:hypothetical protein
MMASLESSERDSGVVTRVGTYVNEIVTAISATIPHLAEGASLPYGERLFRLFRHDSPIRSGDNKKALGRGAHCKASMQRS